MLPLPIMAFFVSTKFPILALSANWLPGRKRANGQEAQEKAATARQGSGARRHGGGRGASAEGPQGRERVGIRPGVRTSHSSSAHPRSMMTTPALPVAHFCIATFALRGTVLVGAALTPREESLGTSRGGGRVPAPGRPRTALRGERVTLPGVGQGFLFQENAVTGPVCAGGAKDYLVLVALSTAQAWSPERAPGGAPSLHPLKHLPKEECAHFFLR